MITDTILHFVFVNVGHKQWPKGHHPVVCCFIFGCQCSGLWMALLIGLVVGSLVEESLLGLDALVEC